MNGSSLPNPHNNESIQFQFDLTKRQRSILTFIQSLSKEKGLAVIPQLKDFELCGVSKTKVKDELERLVELNVIEWNKTENFFSVQDKEKWQVKANKKWDDKRYHSLQDMQRRIKP